MVTIMSQLQSADADFNEGVKHLENGDHRSEFFSVLVSSGANLVGVFVCFPHAHFLSCYFVIGTASCKENKMIAKKYLCPFTTSQLEFYTETLVVEVHKQIKPDTNLML